MLKLQFELEYQKINLVNRWETVAADSKNYLVASFSTISDDWTTPITAIFTNDKDEQPYTVVVGADSTLESNECYVPWEVLKDESNVYVSAYCGNLHTTVTAQFHVYKSGYADGETPTPPSPTVYDAIMQAITNLQNGKQDKLTAGENITIENNEISAQDTNNYNDLSNRPQINGVTLSGNKTDDDLGIQSKIDNLHKLSSDLVDDTNKTNKFVSTSDKASWNAKYDKPNGGIPKTDLDSNVQSSLNKADTAIQDISGKADKATTLSGYGITNAYTKAEVDAKLSSVYRYKGTVATYQDLPSTGLTNGDVYNVEADENNYAWTGTVWDKLGGDIDLSGYQTKIDSSNKLSSDLVDDTNQTNKFVTDTDKTNWNNKLSSANGAVKSSNIDNGAVTTEKLGSGAVTSEKLASNSVTLAKLHSGVIDSTLSTQGAAEAKATGNAIKTGAALVAGESPITASLLEPYNVTFTNVEYTTTAKKLLMADGTIIDFNSSRVSNVVVLTPGTLYECKCLGVGSGGAYFFLYDKNDNISAIYPAVDTDLNNFVFKASDKFKKIQFNVQGSGCYLRAITLNGLEVENNFIELTNHILDTVDYTRLNISFIESKYLSNNGVITDYPNGGNSWNVSNEIDISQYDYLKINACTGWGYAYFAVYDENHNPIYVEVSPNSAPTIYNANIILPENAHYLVISKFGRTFDAYVSYPVFEAPTKKWKGKKWVCIGDSLTEANSTTSKHYFDYVADETGITTANYGIGGTGYVNPSGTAGNFTARMASVPTDADVYTIFGSFNDYAYSINNDIPIGTPEDSGTSTICGYINSAFDALFARVPLANLGVVAPCPWVSVNSVTGTTSKTFAENYVSALRQCCERRSIPFLDLYHDSGLRPWDSNFRDLTYTKDTLHGVHPDETGHAILAPKFSAFLDLLL